MTGGQFVITKREMDQLIQKECIARKCNIRNIELALGIICSPGEKGAWDSAKLMRVDIPPMWYLGHGNIMWPSDMCCGANSCFDASQHRTSGGLLEGFISPVDTRNCTYNKDSLYTSQ